MKEQFTDFIPSKFHQEIKSQNMLELWLNYDGNLNGKHLWNEKSKNEHQQKLTPSSEGLNDVWSLVSS